MARITDPARLREIYGPVLERAAAKELDRLDRHCLRFIAHSPMILLASSDGERLDVSPKGDAPGFVQPDGERAILIPDWPGNNRIDGLRNICAHARVGVIFLIPNVRETLRINGPAAIFDDEDLRARFARKGRLPVTVLRVETEEVFMHCSKSMLRSRLWQPETWPERGALPTLNEVMKDHAGQKGPVEPEDEMIARFEKILY